ncbi:MAG: acetate--CoA ligase family protein [Desulfocapsaceae bacterium]|nr:acetate--CoA ligase family protein [Desulfocapsaceae bacterium]
MILDALFQPQSIAIIGASRIPGKVGYDLLSNLIQGGYQGTIIPVNPSAANIFDIPCFPNLDKHKNRIDLAIIAVPKEMVLATVDGCISAEVKALIIVTSGFRELSEEGYALEQQIVRMCSHHNIRVLGPNCLGLINTANRMNASFAGKMPESGDISIFSQSGALCAAMLDLAAGRHMGMAKVISVGNKADLSEVDILEYMGADPQTKVIVGYLEDISTGDKFVKSAEEAASLKPVIILKSGTTEAGLKAAASHTGVMATIDTAYAAAFKRSGVVRADSFEALFDYATAFALQPLPVGNRILIISNTGGAGTIAADAVERAGMRVAPPNSKTTSSLRDKRPRIATFMNPVYVLGDAPPGRYLAAIESAQTDPDVDAILVILVPQVMTYPKETALEIASFLDGSKPVVASFMGGEDILPSRHVLSEVGLPVYDSPERAVAALRAMYQYSLWRCRPPRMVTRFRVNKRRVERIITRKQRNGLLQVGEVKGKDILSAYGFRIPKGSLAASAEEAVEIAERIGYPVAMKIVSPHIIHKSDLGGVQLNLQDPDAVEDAFELMIMKISRKAPEAVIEGIYVEEMAGKGLEVIIGMNRDPQFGPMLMFGLGGIFVEVLKDVTFNLAPITETEAVQMLKSTRSYAMLEGKRGEKGVDVGAIASGLQRISQLTTDFPQILELDINPFIVGEFGSEPVVADVRMTLGPL